mmetsp:Transcript_26632/g.57792  ORF Transcript_26632/g.57792 Transcript_26632/m.57792 type:complete len:253 (-) Transcript_26632:1537-2295(-)
MMQQTMIRLLVALLAAILHSSSAFVVPSSCSSLAHNTVLYPRGCVRGSAAQSSTSLCMSADTVIEQLTDPAFLENVATGGALAFAGDVIAQSLTSEEPGFPPRDWDKIRTAAFVAFGGLYTGGAQHFIFGFLNASFDDAVKRLLLNQFVLIPLCYYPTFLFMVPTLRAGWEAEGGFGSEEAKARQEELFVEVFGKIPSTLLRNWCFWLPVQFVQFNFVPVDLQVTYCAAFGVIWNAILSWSTSEATASQKSA